MKRSLIGLFALIVVIALLSQIRGCYSGIPYQAMISDDGQQFTVDVATGQRGQSGWTVFRLSGEGTDQLNIIRAAILSQTWIDFTVGAPRLDWATCCNVSARILEMTIPDDQGWN